MVHILGATVLFGTGLGIAFFMWQAHRTGDAGAIAATARIVVVADFCFTLPAVIVQPATGVWLALDLGYPILDGWLLVAILLYVFVGACWLPVVWIQMRLRRLAEQAHHAGSALPGAYYRLFRIWFALGWPAFLSVIAIFFLMIAKPAL
jgi:uncharacterized membrane protein